MASNDQNAVFDEIRATAEREAQALLDEKGTDALIAEVGLMAVDYSRLYVDYQGATMALSLLKMAGGDPTLALQMGKVLAGEEPAPAPVATPKADTFRDEPLGLYL